MYDWLGDELKVYEPIQIMKIFVRSGIRTHAHRSGLRPERSALDLSAILTSYYVRMCTINTVNTKDITSYQAFSSDLWKYNSECYRLYQRTLWTSLSIKNNKISLF